jgi:hypothetical protein
MTKPYFTHHCADCSYLGSADINGRKMDFYHCGKSFCKRGTILWRESDEESDYGSCPISSITALNTCAMLGLNLWLNKRGLCGWSGFNLEGRATFKSGESVSVSPDKSLIVECMERLADKLRDESLDGARADLVELAMMVLPDDKKREFARRV